MTKKPEIALLDTLNDVRRQVHEQYPEAKARLAQLDAHMSTVAMVITHIKEEAARTASAQGG